MDALVEIEDVNHYFEVVDVREIHDIPQTNSLNLRLEKDNVVGDLGEYRKFLGKYVSPMMDKMKITIVEAKNISEVLEGEIRDGCLKIGLLNSGLVDRVDSMLDEPQVKQLHEVGLTYGELMIMLGSSTILHEGQHLNMDSKPGSMLDRDFERITGIENSEGSHLLTLLDESITYAFQYLRDEVNPDMKKLLLLQVPEKNESFLVKTRKRLGEEMVEITRKYIDEGKGIDDEYLGIIGEKIKSVAGQYVEESRIERQASRPVR